MNGQGQGRSHKIRAVPERSKKVKRSNPTMTGLSRHEVRTVTEQQLSWRQDNPIQPCHEPLASGNLCQLPEGHPGRCEDGTPYLDGLYGPPPEPPEPKSST